MLLYFAVDKLKPAIDALEQISSLQAEVLQFLFKIGTTGANSKASYDQAAEYFGLTPEAVEAIETGALRALRRKKIN